MAQKFVLGPNAARAVRQLMHGTGTVGSRPANGPAVVADLDYLPPFSVKWAQSVNDGNGSWIIWLPSESCLMVGGEAIDIISELEEAGGDYPDGWYKLACLEEEDESLFLNVHIKKSDDDPEETTATFSVEEDEPEEGETVWPILVCTMSGKNVAQTVTSAITIVSGGSGASPDLVSIDFDDDSDLELAHFADGEKDSGKGLACRLKADVETGEITASDSDDSLMLVCRKGGEVIYVPLGGGEEETDPDDEDKNSPCEHPDDNNGTSGGVDPTKDDSGSSGVTGGASGGGVVIGDTDTTHPGDSDCNCNK